MITCEKLFELFDESNLLFFTGVPDSTFKGWTRFLADEHGNKLTNVIACNECEAVAIASGYHLATGKIGVVYMQNSGEGKAVNPLTSLCDPEVFSIPVMLMIGWRGEPGVKDEPQHRKMGKVMMPLLEALEVPYRILPDEPEKIAAAIKEMKDKAEKENTPVAIIVRKGVIGDYEAKVEEKESYSLTREEAIKIIAGKMDGSEVIVSTTGKASRELFEYRDMKKQAHKNDFYTLGSMGCSASIALGISLQSKRKVFIFDGDGAVLMQMGALATIGHYGQENVYHIIFDNSSYGSTGGQPTISPTVDFGRIAFACGYKSAQTVSTEPELLKALDMESKGPSILVIKVKKGSRSDLGRPTTSPVQSKEELMKFLTE
ncbi:phosphonopyruvate decarboxylase [Candidatus Woesearchaeota archaeon]|nr:phosphonopyruvate decarboxylase [Candidatus Woesearchaeota archaeon]|tara:strand:+ start:17610 stop:18731 length:1122 start_codon:yes stop_codon:yes gene_type:complete